MGLTSWLQADKGDVSFPDAHKWAGEQESTALITSSDPHFKPSNYVYPKADEIMKSVGWAGLWSWVF